ncbi:hypothetical protein YC2023_038445 [Brassica napus]|uniref:Uncharacterized protein n=1 Tax=Brassica oleracea TaxID=3712 RepID=A0A3P6B9H9_BRAOL|nr:unnamed protein product [Brassica oleracea]
MDFSSHRCSGTVRFRDGYQEKTKSLEGRFWYSENWDNRFFQRDIHNGIQATKGISSGCYLQGIELWEYKWDTVNNGLCQGCQDLYMGAKQRIKKRDISRAEGACEVYIWTSDHGRLIDS